MVKVPRKSHIQFDAIVGQSFFDKIDVNIVRMSSLWDVRDAMVYVKMRPGTSVSDSRITSIKIDILKD